MSVNIPSFFATQYATNVQLLLQQKGSKLRNAVRMGPHIGQAASPVDQIGAINMQPVTGRFAPMGRVDAFETLRWVYPSDYDLPQLIDSFDKLRLLVDPKSAYVENAVYAAGRQIDSTIINGLLGTNQTGVNGGNAVTFPAGQQIAIAFGAAVNTGLTVAKLRQARLQLLAANVDLESDTLWCAMGAQQMDDLLAEAQVISTDFNDKPVLVDGKITRFLGINFIHTELVPTVNGVTTVPVWAQSGAYLGMWNDISTSISVRHDLQSEPWQAYVYMTIGATRLEELKVVSIACNQ